MDTQEQPPRSESPNSDSSDFEMIHSENKNNVPAAAAAKTETKPVSKPEPTKITSAPKNSAVVGKENNHALSFITNFTNSFPDFVREIMLFSNPVKSGIVVVSAFATFFLLTCNCTYSLLWLVSTIMFWILLAFIGVTALYKLFYKFVKKEQNVPSPVSKFIVPQVNRFLSPVANNMDRDIVVKKVHELSDMIPAAVGSLGDIFCCEDLSKSGKAVLVLAVLKFIGCLFSGYTLVFIGMVLFFSLPVGYHKFQSKIDPHADKIAALLCEKIELVKSKLPFLNKSKPE